MKPLERNRTEKELFDRQITVAQEHLADLRRRVEDLPETERQPVLIEALEEVSVNLEELQVASEELRQQNEELATAQRYAETERQRYLELFDFAPEGYVVTDLDGTIQETNRAASTLLRIPQRFLQGKPLIVFVPEEDLKALRVQLARFPVLERLEDWVTTFRPRDGKPFPAAITVTTVPGSGGKPPSLRWMIHDISERKRMDEELRQSENRLRVLSEKLLTVQEDERKRVAWDLHDSLATALAVIKYNIEGVIRLLQDNGIGKKAVPPLEHALADVQNLLEEVRRIYMDLRPTLLDDLGIQATASWFIREFQKGHPRVRVENEIEIAESEVSEPLKIILYRILQEAFLLVVRQSRADVIRFSLGRRNDRIEMTIRENGDGFKAGDPPDGTSSRKDYGLLWIRERVELSGGSFEIESLKEGETAIRASWPAARVSSPSAGEIS